MHWLDEFNSDYHDQLYALYRQEWWTKGRPVKDVVSAFDNSDLVFGCLTDDDQLIACARVLSDFTFKVLIFDVIIAKNHRGQGLGKHMLDQITGHEKLANVRSFELYCPDHIRRFMKNMALKRAAQLYLDYSVDYH